MRRALLTSVAAIVLPTSVMAQQIVNLVPPTTLQFPVISAVRTGSLLSLTVVGQGQADNTIPATAAVTSHFAPLSQFFEGYTALVKYKGLTPTGSLTDYHPGSWPSPNLCAVVNRPGYDNTGAATTVVTKACATNWLRLAATTSTPTEATSGSDGVFQVALDSYIYAADSVGTATSASGFYTGSVASTAASTNNSTLQYQPPVGKWLSKPYRRLDGTANYTAEFLCQAPYAAEGKGCKVVTFILSDGTHTVTHPISTEALSGVLRMVQCTASPGSAVLTCPDVTGFTPGQRLTVWDPVQKVSIPGEPKILSINFGAKTLTLGSTENCPSASGGDITVNTTSLAPGDALADGAFLNQTITDAAAATYTINAKTVTADNTGTNPVTATKIHTNAVSITTGSCTINHVWPSSAMGATVNVVIGDPVYSFQATFTTGEIATMNDNGWAHLRAVACPYIGDNCIDTELGGASPVKAGVFASQYAATINGPCDWWGNNSGVTNQGNNCPNGNGAKFNANGADVAVNLHNLPIYIDRAGCTGGTTPCYSGYVPVRAGGTCVTAACVSATPPTDPGAGCTTTCAGSMKDGETALKAFFNASFGHNNANGGVECVGPDTYLGFGGSMAGITAAALPVLEVRGIVTGSACVLNPDQSQTIIGHSATGANRTIGQQLVFNGVTVTDVAGAGVMVGADSLSTTRTVFPTYYVEFDNSTLVGSAGQMLSGIGYARFYNDLVDEHAAEANVWAKSGATSYAVDVFGSTGIGGTFGASTNGKAKWYMYAAVGNVTFAMNVQPPPALDSATASGTQPLSSYIQGNKFMYLFQPIIWGNQPAVNVNFTQNVVEMGAAGGQGAMFISADGSGSTNFIKYNNNFLGGRDGEYYNSGVGASNGTPTSGGTLVNGHTYQIEYIYGLTPGVEGFDTDGVGGTCAVGAGGACSIAIQPEPAYKSLSILINDLTSPGTFTGYAVCGGIDCSAANGTTPGKTIVITGTGTSTGSLPTPGSGGYVFRTELKTTLSERYNVDISWGSMKRDIFGGGAGATSGSRVGVWAAGNVVDEWYNVRVAGNPVQGLPGQQSGSGGGESGEVQGWTNVANWQLGANDQTGQIYGGDRSYGGANSSTVVSPALGLGYSWACRSGGNLSAFQPAGQTATPADIRGIPWANDGTDPAGAYGSCS